LNKGTYYFSLNDSKSLSFYGPHIIKITADKIAVEAPKVTSCKSRFKTVSSTAEKNAEIYVVCNEDTFIGTVDSQG